MRLGKAKLGKAGQGRRRAGLGSIKYMRPIAFLFFYVQERGGERRSSVSGLWRAREYHCCCFERGGGGWEWKSFCPSTLNVDANFIKINFFYDVSSSFSFYLRGSNDGKKSLPSTFALFFSTFSTFAASACFFFAFTFASVTVVFMVAGDFTAAAPTAHFLAGCGWSVGRVNGSCGTRS